MDTNNIKVFDIDECIKTFRKTYKVPKKQKETIINYIFNIYLVIKKDGEIDNSISKDDNLVTETNNTDDISQKISIQLDSKGLNQLLSYVNLIPEKYKLKTKQNKQIIKTHKTNNNISSNKVLTNNTDTSNILQLENNNYPLLTYQDDKGAENVKKNGSLKDNKVKSKQLCLGRTAKHTQCSRSCKPGTLFCQSHINNNCPYGRIDEEIKIPKEKIVKKRGRKRKVEINDKFKNDDFITIWPEIVEGNKFLVDRYNNIYTFDLVSPRFIGVKQLDGKIDTSSPLLTSVF